MKNNKEFIWLCPRGNAGSHRDFTNGLVQTYSWMESNQIYPDKIVIINYTRQQTPFSIFPVLSATNRPAITFTGALYWATEKYLGNNLCTTPERSKPNSFRLCRSTYENMGR